MTALLGEAAIFIPGYECHSPVAPSDFDRLISGYRLTGGPLCVPLPPYAFNLDLRAKRRWGVAVGARGARVHTPGPSAYLGRRFHVVDFVLMRAMRRMMMDDNDDG